MKLYLPILVIFISILSCSKEKEPSDDKGKEGITVEKSILLDTSLNNGIDPLEIKENENLGSEVDSLKLLEEQNRKISELMTYLNNPIEENYNYKWNDNVSAFPNSFDINEYKRDSKVDSVLNLVCLKRKEILLSEFRHYLENPVDSNYKKEWKYNLYKTDDIVFDSLKLLSFYMGYDDLLSNGRYVKDNFDYKVTNTISIFNETCLSDLEEDSRNYGLSSDCLQSRPMVTKFFDENIEVFRQLYIKLDSSENKILGYGVDFLINDLDRESSWERGTRLIFKKDNGQKVMIVLTEDISWKYASFDLSTKLNNDGELKVSIKNHLPYGEYYEIGDKEYIAFITDYDVVLNYELSESLDIEFKGIRMLDKENK